MSPAADSPTPVARRHNAGGVHSEALSRRVKAARAASRQPVRSTYGLLVAAEADQREARGLVAHAVYDIGELSPTHGLTLCGLLAGEEASVIPQMRWPDVADQDRCDLCAAQERARPQVM